MLTTKHLRPELSGFRWRDPMIGRDALIGAVAGLTMAALALLVVILPPWFGGTALDPIIQWLSPLVSIRNLLCLGLTKLIEVGVMLPLEIGVMLVLLIPVLRRRPYALAAICHSLHQRARAGNGMDGMA